LVRVLRIIFSASFFCHECTLFSLAFALGCAVKRVWFIFALFLSSRVFLKNKLISHRGKKTLNQKLLSCISTVFGGILTNKTSGARERSESERAFTCSRTRASSPPFPLRETALF